MGSSPSLERITKKFPVAVKLRPGHPRLVHTPSCTPCSSLAVIK